MSLQFGPLAALSKDSVLYLVVHTQAAPGNSDGSAASIHSYHRSAPPHGRGWSGIGYHRVIRKGGAVEEGRPLNRKGAHVNGINHASIGICCSGNGDIADFTAAQKDSLVDLLRDLQTEFPRATVAGHRPLVDRLIDSGALSASLRTSKTCPGNKVRLDDVLQRLGGGAIDGPSPGERRWSNHLNEYVILTRFESDSNWYFVPESELRGLGARAGAEWSRMPLER